MTNLTLYRVLTFILLPFALLLGGTAFFMLLMALGQPQLLLQVFMMTAFVIYVFGSLRFLSRHIEPGKPAKISLRDWIRVNGIVAGVMAVLSIASFVTTIQMSAAQVKDTYDRMMDIQPNMSGMMNVAFYGKLMRIAAYVSLGFGLVTLVHVVMSFKLTKKHAHLFQ